MKLLLISLIMLAVAACGTHDEDAQSASKTVTESPLAKFMADKTTAEDVVSAAMTEQDAIDLSPIGRVCVRGEITEIFVPTNRGRGNDNGEWVTVDQRDFLPAVLRGDLDQDGVAYTLLDAKMGTRNIYVKALDNSVCPAQYDVATFPRNDGYDENGISIQPDGFLTAEDLYIFNQIKKNGGAEYLDEDLICLDACFIPNHMSPEFKH